MFVLEELKKSIKDFEAVVKEINKTKSLVEFDNLETKAQKIVFELQMKANQIAGEVVPMMTNKRADLRNANAANVMAKVRKAQERATKVVKSKDLEKISKTVESEPEVTAPVEEEKVEETTDNLPKDSENLSKNVEEKEDGDSNRQPEPNAGDSEPKLAEKAE